MTKLQASCTNAATGITNFKQVTAQLQTSAQTLTDKLAAQKQKVADLEAAYEKSKAETGENSEETKKLAAQLEQAKQKVSQTEQALKLVTQQLKLSQNGFYQLGTQLENIGAKLETVGKKVSQVGQQLTTKLTTPIVALGTVCIKTFTSFDDSLKTVQATMGLVAGSSEEADRQIALLNSTAQEMGRSTRYSASEAAEALNYLALAGYDADEACAALPQVLPLALAGGLDLAYASDLATDAMAALGLSMDELGSFSDQMAVTAQKSNTSVGQLGEAILTVGGTAKGLKGGTAELNAELGILANRGIKGAEGGTHLRNVILSLTKPTDKAAAQLKALGVSVYDSSGNMRSMNDMLPPVNPDGYQARMLYSVSSAPQPQDAKRAQRILPLLCSALRSIVLFSMAVKPLSVKNMRRTEGPISCIGLPAPGILIGLAGIILAWPLYQKVLRKAREKAAPEILQLSKAI
ncbi:MAG: phage tail tape measure protein [Clostridia bacterium]|nr:phage tail tape measure protein [Clostridia bacterium]